MTHRLNQVRKGLRFNDNETPYSLTAEAFGTLPQVTVQGVAKGGAKMGDTYVHLVACDCQNCGAATHRHLEGDTWLSHPCMHESYNDPIPDHEDYVPDGWGVYPDGTHKCPDCRTKRALERDEKHRSELIAQGVTVEELRAAMREFHSKVRE